MTKAAGVLSAGAVTLAIAVMALSATPGSAVAQEAAPRKSFKVCQDPNNLPFSSLKGEGYENKIAELFAKDLGLPVEYYSFPARLAFVRNTLRYKLPGQDFRCDIIMGVPAGFDQVSATKPYYRSAYALVFAKAKGLENVQSIDDFLKLDRAVLSKLRIGIYDRSPASEWLNKHQLVEQGVPYQIMNADPNQYPGEIIEKDLANGKLDAAVVWGPIGGYYAKQVKQQQLVVLPLTSEPGVKFDFAMAMGVRYGEREWKQQIEALIEKRQPEITAILRDFNVPLLDPEAAPASRP